MKGDPHCVLHAHHIIPRSQGGIDAENNLVTVCDLCHAVVTPRWHNPWFGVSSTESKGTLEGSRQEFNDFLSLDPSARFARQVAIWSHFGVTQNNLAQAQTHPYSPTELNV
jgi:hypothetical protein